MKEPGLKKPRCLEDLTPHNREVCEFFSKLGVVFSTAELIKLEYSPGTLKDYIGIPLPPAFAYVFPYLCALLVLMSNWNPNAKQLRRSWPKAWWNPHQVFLLGPSLLSVFGEAFSLSATLGIAITSLRSNRKLCLVRAFCFACALV